MIGATSPIHSCLHPSIRLRLCPSVYVFVSTYVSVVSELGLDTKRPCRLRCLWRSYGGRINAVVAAAAVVISIIYVGC